MDNRELKTATVADLDIEDLTGRIADGWERYQRANADRIGAALDTGAGLIELRKRLPHGDFLPAVQRLGIGQTTAQNWMRLSRAGFKSATVAHLGGVRAALEHLRGQAKTADAARRFDLESENAGLRRRLADAMVNADADGLESLSRIVRVQKLLRESRDVLNVGIAEKDSLTRERDSSKRENAELKGVTK